MNKLVLRKVKTAVETPAQLPNASVVFDKYILSTSEYRFRFSRVSSGLALNPLMFIWIM